MILVRRAHGSLRMNVSGLESTSTALQTLTIRHPLQRFLCFLSHGRNYSVVARLALEVTIVLTEEKVFTLARRITRIAVMLRIRRHRIFQPELTLALAARRPYITLALTTKGLEFTAGAFHAACCTDSCIFASWAVAALHIFWLGSGGRKNCNLELAAGGAGRAGGTAWHTSSCAVLFRNRSRRAPFTRFRLAHGAGHPQTIDKPGCHTALARRA